MKSITSACANKMLRSLEDEKSYWVEKEELSSTYVAAVGEEPVIPEYDYAEVSRSSRLVQRNTKGSPRSS